MRYFVIALVMVFVCAVAYLPMAEWNQWPLPWSKLEIHYGDFGGWLQGVLTPAILLVALLTWFFQQRSAREANIIQARTFLLQFLHNFYGHINYTAACAIVGHRPSGQEVPYGNLECVNALIHILREQKVPAKLLNTNIDTLKDINQIRKGENYALLAQSLQFMDGMVRSAHMKLLVDQRIQDLASLVR